MTGLMLVATIGSLVAAAYVAVRRTSILGSSARLLGSAQQVAGLLKTSGDTLLAVTRRVSDAPVLRAYLRDPKAHPPADLVTALQGVPQPDRLVAAELWNAAGRRVFAWGPFATAVDSIRVGEIERVIAVGEPASLGGFRAVGDTVVYPVAASVMDGARRLGTVVHWRRQTSSTQSRDQVATLFGGPGTVMFLGDTAGHVWTDLVGKVPGPPVRVIPGAPAVKYERAGAGGRFAVAGQGPGTPWVAVIDVPSRGVTQPADHFLRQISGIALAFLVLASFITWLISRSITRPLARMAAVADAFNAGDHTRRVSVDRDDEFAHVAAAFNRMAEGIQYSFEALKDADRKKDEFLATLAHELRNPLAPIQNGVASLRVTHRAPDARTEKMYQVMDRQLGVLTRLVDDLLEISRVTRGTVELRKEPVDLATVVQHALESARPIIDHAHHHLRVDVPAGIIINGDPVRLSQILFNLLNNAAKYTSAGGEIEIKVSRAHDEALIAVKDNGVGIASDMLERVFDMFVQVNAPGHTGSGGLGVGLTLVRKLAELHGGRVEAHSDGPGRGSEFVVHLPMQQGQLRLIAPGASSAGHAADVRALVVDDNADAADMLAEVLSAMGVVVSVAYSGPDALQRVAAERPRIVFLDIGMPGMDGYEVARQIRSGPEPGVMLVAVTGWGAEEDRRKSAEAGFDLHLVKPVGADRLRELLGSLAASMETAQGPS